MASNGEREEEQPAVEVPSSTDEQTVSSELIKDHGEEQQRSEDHDPAESGVNTKEKEEEKEPTAKPVKQAGKLWCSDPTGTSDIALGQSGITADKPTTVSKLFKYAFETWPNVKALCWKDKKEEPWKSLTYTEYRKLIYNTAKSFLKVIHSCGCTYVTDDFNLVVLLNNYEFHLLARCALNRFQLCK